MSEELDNIRNRYKKREGYTESAVYSDLVVAERNLLYKKIIFNHFQSIKEIKILEIGAGSGGNIGFFKSLGILPDNIYANELLMDRVEQLKENHPDIRILSGDAREISESNFDIIFQSTVFTSILDDDFRRELSDKMWTLLKPKGIILWYDFIYNNPKNPDVKKVTRKELIDLFHKENLVFSKKITLAPPIGRKVGKAYSLFNCIPILRSHMIAVFKKK